jgi:hypothetical protein
MDLEFDDPRPRYRLCQLGFGLIALSLGLLSFDLACWLATLFMPNPGLIGLMKRPEWTWLVGAPITWAALIGSYLLWGRWTEPTWQRRAGLLVLMNGVDAVNWLLEHAHEFGLTGQAIGHAWMREQIGRGLGWLELLLTAAMAADLSLHLGKADAPEAGRSARSFAMIGFALWLFHVLVLTDWMSWPLRRHPMRGRDGLLFFLGNLFLLTVTSFQVTVLSILAARQCKRFVQELDRHEWDNDLLRSRSEPEKDDQTGPKRPKL